MLHNYSEAEAIKTVCSAFLIDKDYKVFSRLICHIINSNIINIKQAGVKERNKKSKLFSPFETTSDVSVVVDVSAFQLPSR
jgi:hypothetical protein